MPFVVPAQFAALRRARNGEAGVRWVASLPELVDELCQDWGLTVETTPPRYGDNGLVVPVRRAGEPLVLKLAWQQADSVEEPLALQTWNGRGAVQLLEHRPGALLLERLDAERSLATVPLPEAVEEAGRLLRRLAVPAPRGVRRLSDVALELADRVPRQQAVLGHPVPERLLATAVGLARDLAQHTTDLLVHADLHYGNVLAGIREPWLAVDPKPVAGDPEHAVPELLWTRTEEVPGTCDRLAALVAAASLNADKARAWALVRCVDYWLWGLANGLTDDPVRCRRIAEVLM